MGAIDHWPVPVSAISCGEPYPPFVIFTSAVSVPTLVGLKVTVITHDPPAATLAPQVLVCEKDV